MSVSLTKVWVVCGEEGYYSDYSMWIVRAFTSCESDAKRFAESERMRDARGRPWLAEEDRAEFGVRLVGHGWTPR